NMTNWKLAMASAMLPLALAACGSSSSDDDEATTPPPVAETPRHITAVELLGRYESGMYGVSAAEIPAYDAGTRRAFVVNAQSGQIDVLDLSRPASPTHLGTL